MDEVFSLIADVGMPIAGSLIMGVFIFIVIKQILAGIIDQIKTLTMFCESLENRARTMSNEIVKLLNIFLCAHQAQDFHIYG